MVYRFVMSPYLALYKVNPVLTCMNDVLRSWPPPNILVLVTGYISPHVPPYCPTTSIAVA